MKVSKIAFGMTCLALCDLGAVSLASENRGPTSGQVKRTTGQGEAVGRLQASRRIPDNFMSYATTPIHGNMQCVVGAATDEDGLNQKPVVYLAPAEGSASASLRWVDVLRLPADTYQSRATHCVGPASSLYVLLQSDTQPEQTLSQTLLAIVKVDVATGAVQAREDIAIPGAHTAWVEKGAAHFRWSDHALLVTGNYRKAADQEKTTPFAVRFNSDLQPQHGD